MAQSKKFARSPRNRRGWNQTCPDSHTRRKLIIPEQNRGIKIRSRFKKHPWESAEDLAAINYVADKYGLTLKEICLLLDEDDVFDITGELNLGRLEERSNAIFMQNVKREEERDWALIGQAFLARSETAAGSGSPEDGPWFEVPEWLAGKYDKAAYNRMLATQPYTQALRLLIAENVSQATLKLFSKLNLYYKLPDAVLNALVHHMRVMSKPWKENYIEKVAASLQGQGIRTYGQAVAYFLKEQEAARAMEEGKAAGDRVAGPGKPRPRAGRKPKLPIYDSEGLSEPLTPEEEAELERIVRRLERQ